MKKLFLGLLLCTGVAFADAAVPAADYPWPTSPVPFRIVSAPIDTEWKGGRPFASRSDLAKLIHISPEGSQSVDLIEALTEKGWLVRKDHNGDLEAINPKGVSAGGKIDPKNRDKNLTAAKYKAPTKEQEKKKDNGTPPPAANNGANGIDPNTGLPYSNGNNPNTNPNVKH